MVTKTSRIIRTTEETEFQVTSPGICKLQDSPLRSTQMRAKKSLGAVLAQKQEDGSEPAIAFAS